LAIFLKQILAGKAAEQLETMWSEKVRRASRELETLRNDLKSQTQRTEDIERMVDAEADRVKAAREEVAAEKGAGGSTEFGNRWEAGEDLFSRRLCSRMEDKLDAAAGQAVALESVVREKSEALGNLTAAVEKSLVDSNAKDADVQALTARVGELEWCPESWLRRSRRLRVGRRSTKRWSRRRTGECRR